MVKLLLEDMSLHKQQEARNFVGKKGIRYVESLATKEEKQYFEGSIYHSGVPDLSLISYMASTSSFY